MVAAPPFSSYAPPSRRFVLAVVLLFAAAGPFGGLPVPTVRAFVVPNSLVPPPSKKPTRRGDIRPFRLVTARLRRRREKSSLSSLSDRPDGGWLGVTPDPDYSAVQVAELCMDALRDCCPKTPRDGLAVCFAFSSDRCRAAGGGTLDAFVRHASNPTFGAMVGCGEYKVLSVGPPIPPSQHRGEMRTVLVEVTAAAAAGGVAPPASGGAASPRPSRRPTVEERMRARERRDVAAQGGRPEDVVPAAHDGPAAPDDGKRVYLWTLQRERRPPRQDCWLVHEVLYKRNAFMQTY